MSESTIDNEYGFTPYSRHLPMLDVKVYYSKQNPLIMVDVKVYYSKQEWVQTTNPLIMVYVKVYYSKQEWVETLC